MLNNVRSVASCFVALSFVVAACGDGDGDGGGTGATGGGAGKGGSAGSTGGSSGSTGKGGSSGTTGKGGSAGSSGSSSGTGGSNAGTSGSAGAGSGGEGGDDTGSGGDAGTGNGTGGAGDGGMPGTGGTGDSGAAGGDDGSGGAPEAGGMGGEPSIGAGGNGTAGEGGAPITGLGGEGGEGGATVPEWDSLKNGDFEIWIEANELPPNWTAVGTSGAATYTWNDQGGAHGGTGFLDLWLASAYEVTVSQVLSPIPNGSYTLTLYQRGGTPTAYTDQYVYVTGYDQANATAEMKVDTIVGGTYTLLTIANIPVTSGELEVGIYSNGPGNAWTNIDDVVLVQNP